MGRKREEADFRRRGCASSDLRAFAALAGIRAISPGTRRPISPARAIGDRAYFGPELEHFAKDEVHYDQGVNYGYYEIDAVEANWKASQSRRFSHIVSR